MVIIVVFAIGSLLPGLLLIGAHQVSTDNIFNILYSMGLHSLVTQNTINYKLPGVLKLSSLKTYFEVLSRVVKY